MSDADLVLTYSLKPDSDGVKRAEKVIKRLSNLDKSWESMNVMERAAAVLEELNSGWGDIAKRAAENSLKEAKKAKSIGMKSFNKGKAHRVVIADDSQLLLSAGDEYGALSVDVNSVWKTIHDGMVKAAKYRPLKPITDPFIISESRGIISGGRRFSMKKSGEFQWDDEGIWYDVSSALPHKEDVISEVRDYLWHNYPTLGYKAKIGPTKRNIPYTNYRPDWQFITDERRDSIIPLNTAVPIPRGYIPDWERYEGVNNGALIRSAIRAILNYAYVPNWQSKFGIDVPTDVGPYRGAQDADYKSLGYEYVKDRPQSKKKKDSLFTKATDFMKERISGALGNIKDSVIRFAEGLPIMVLETIGRLIVSELLHITTLSFDITKKLFFMPAKTLVTGLYNILKSAASQSQIIQSIMQLTIIPFVLMFEYLLLPVVKAIIPIITNMVKIIATNKDSIMKWGGVMADFITKVVGPIVGMFDGKFFSNPVSGVFDIMTGIMDSASEWLRNNSKAIGNLLYDSLVSIGEFISSNGKLAAEITSSIADSISDYFGSDSFKEMYPSIKDAFVSILDSVRQVLTDPVVVSAMKDLVTVFIQTLFGIAGELLGYGNSYRVQREKIQEFGLDESVTENSKFRDISDWYAQHKARYDQLPEVHKNYLDRSYASYGGYSEYLTQTFNTYMVENNIIDTFGAGQGAIMY